MRILKARLRNVKSFGEDVPEVEFSDGVNFLSGMNGAGKSTLIEALGYALFDVLPCNKQEFVRRGAKTGTVTAWIEDQREVFQVERKFGSTNTWVVYDKDRVSIHEKRDDVVRFLCERFRIPDPGQLPEVFRRILGVPQGTFTSLFLMTGAVRKEIFDRIINVHVYRDRAEDHKDVKNRMVVDEIRGLEKRLEGAKAYIEDHKKDPKDLADTEERLKAAAGQADELGGLKSALDRKKKVFESLRSGIEDLARRIAGIEAGIGEGEKALKLARAEVERSRAAAAACAAHEAGHRAYLEAEKRAAALEKRRAERDALSRQSHELEKKIRSGEASVEEIVKGLARRREAQRKGEGEVEALEGEWKAEDASARSAAREADEAGKARERLEEALDKDRKKEADFKERLSLASSAAGRIREGLEECGRLEKSLATFEEVERAAAGAEEARRRERSLGDRLARAEAAVREQEENRKQLAGQVCPFIRERCDRVKPSVFQAKIDGLEEQIRVTKRELAKAREASGAAAAAEKKLAGLGEKKEQLSEARRAVRREWARARRSLADWKPFWGKVPGFPGGDEGDLDLAPFERYGKELEAEMDRRSLELKARQRAEKESASAAGGKRKGADAALRRLEDARSRLKDLRGEISEREGDLEKSRRELEELRRKGNELSRRLKDYDSLDGDLKGARDLQEAHRGAHQEYGRNESMASDLKRREKDEAEREKEVAEARSRLGELRADRARLSSSYDSREASKVEEELEDVVGRLAAAENERKNLEEKRRELAESVGRLREQQAAAGRWEKEGARLERFQALLDDLWDVLRALGPRVSERLLGMISGQANRIFSVLHDQPGRLVWERDYEVRLKQGGEDYPFANLSGGEQMSAALAIQMAMARAFVGSSFCVFDEPTIHLDEARRRRLASAIREAQVDARFTQVFVVSHDDTFGPYVDRQIRFVKDGPRGTRIAD